jgi:hypothetical protein
VKAKTGRIITPEMVRHWVRSFIADCCAPRHLFHTFAASIFSTFNGLEVNLESPVSATVRAV